MQMGETGRDAQSKEAKDEEAQTDNHQAMELIHKNPLFWSGRGKAVPLQQI